MGTDSDTTFLNLRLRQVAARITGDRAIWACGRTPRVAETADGSPRPTKTCDRAWECALCAVPTLLERRADIRWSLNAAREVGSQVLFVTLTVSHSLDDAVEGTTRMLEDAYDYLLNDGRRGTVLRRELDIWLIDRTFQVAWGEQGFHPHYHLLVFLKPGARADAVVVEKRLASAWREALDATAQKSGRDTSRPKRGVHVREVTDDDAVAFYLTKLPVGPSGTPTGVFVALVEVAKHGDGDCYCPQCRRWVARWREYAAAVTGHRKRFWARGVTSELQAAGATPKPPRNLRGRKVRKSFEGADNN